LGAKYATRIHKVDPIQTNTLQTTYNPIFFSTTYISLYEIGRDLLTGEAYHHTWYLHVALGLYLITPLITHLQSKIRTFTLLAGAIVLVSGSMYYLTLFFNDTLHISLFTQFVFLSGYYLAGHGLRHIPLHLIGMQLLVLVYMFSTIMSIVLRFIMHYQNMRISLFSMPLSPFIIISAVSLFMIFLHIDLKKNPLSSLAPFTLGIYLIHPLVLDIISAVFKHTLTPVPLLNLFLDFVIVVGISVGIVNLFNYARNIQVKRIA